MLLWWYIKQETTPFWWRPFSVCLLSSHFPVLATVDANTRPRPRCAQLLQCLSLTKINSSSSFISTCESQQIFSCLTAFYPWLTSRGVPPPQKKKPTEQRQRSKPFEWQNSVVCCCHCRKHDLSSHVDVITSPSSELHHQSCSVTGEMCHKR